MFVLKSVRTGLDGTTEMYILTVELFYYKYFKKIRKLQGHGKVKYISMKL